MMNYMQVDANKLLWMSFQFSALVSMPVQIIGAIVMMYKFIGISFVSGAVVIMIGAVINFFLGKRYLRFFILLHNMLIEANPDFLIRLQKLVMTKRDERMKVTTEILNGIKFIKMNGWEEYFLKKVNFLYFYR